MTKEGFDVLIDSDAFVGKIHLDDSHHSVANKIFSNIVQKQYTLVTTNLVIMETATVLSHRAGQSYACAFLKQMQRGNIPVIHLSEKLEKEAYTIFSRQTKKGTSVTDCANVAVMRHFQIPKIFSFDKVYQKSFHLRTMSSSEKEVLG